MEQVQIINKRHKLIVDSEKKTITIERDYMDLTDSHPDSMVELSLSEDGKWLKVWVGYENYVSLGTFGFPLNVVKELLEGKI